MFAKGTIGFKYLENLLTFSPAELKTQRQL